MKEYKVKVDNQEHTLVFNPDAKGSQPRYTIDGKRATGVTTILGAINKPALVDWAAKMAYQDCEVNQYSPEQLKKIVTEKDYAHKKKSGDAMDVGTKAHADVERYIRFRMGETNAYIIDKDTEHIVRPFIEWAEGRMGVKVSSHRFDKHSIEIAPTGSEGIKFLNAEQSVFSLKYFFAGTYDFLCEIDGKKYICDFKTSSGIYGREYFYQTSAYRAALEELGLASDIVGSVIIRSGKEGNDLEVKHSLSYEEDFRAFKAAYVIYKEGFVDVDVDESLTLPH